MCPRLCPHWYERVGPGATVPHRKSPQSYWIMLQYHSVVEDPDLVPSCNCLQYFSTLDSMIRPGNGQLGPAAWLEIRSCTDGGPRRLAILTRHSHRRGRGREHALADEFGECDHRSGRSAPSSPEAASRSNLVDRLEIGPIAVADVDDALRSLPNYFLMHNGLPLTTPRHNPPTTPALGGWPHAC